MSLIPGTRLGAYQVIAHVGEGGMGQVFRARDTKLNRDVALKVLPQAFAGDAGRVARFTREAQTLALLNHPAVAHIHGVEESGGVRALVMEFVEGDDLSQHIARGALPVDEALAIARQVAEALEAAHDLGIVHRDLKPANIKLRPDGAVKVLDFGLAKALSPEPGSASAVQQSLSPTITSPALVTGVGMLLGTAAYMSPEQAKGQEADKRSDVWAFGCVVYEMLTGRRPFDGDDMAEVLGAVVRLEPDWSALPSDLPSQVRTLLQRCLVKDRRKRIGAIAAALFVLDLPATAAAPPAPARSNRLAWGSAALALVIAATLGAMWALRPGPPLPEAVEFTIEPPQNTVFGGPISGGTGRAPQLAVSPDGRNIVFVVGVSSTFQLWIRPVASAVTRPIEGTDGATFPFWSPDNQSIGFFAGGKLKRIAVTGGPAIELADAPAGRGGSWNRDNVIVFDRATAGSGLGVGPAPSGLFRVPAAGGSATPVTMIEPGEDAHRWPHFLPDGQHFFYTAVTGACCPPARPGTVKIGSLDPNEASVPLFQGDSAASYSSGHVFFARDEALFAQRFDPDARKLVGDAIPVAGRVTTEGSRYVSASISQTGTLVYAGGGAANPLQLRWFDRSGRPLGTLGEGAIDANPVLSPDERQVAVAMRSGNASNLDIWTIDIARNLRNRVTSSSVSEGWPVWSHDGTRLAFGGGAGERQEKATIRQLSANGTGSEQLLVEATSTPSRPCAPRQCTLAPSDWSTDNRYLLYTFSGSFPATSDVWAVPLFGDHMPFPILESRFTERLATFSPDGRWIAYMSDEAGEPNVYVQSFPRDSGKYRVSPNGGRNPHWRGDGKELFYLDEEGVMTAVPITTSDTIEAGKPTPLFRTGVISLNQMFAVTRDGQRFLVNAREQSAAPQNPLTVVVNWAPTLRK